jgi:hypothetical protein
MLITGYSDETFNRAKDRALYLRHAVKSLPMSREKNRSLTTPLPADP